MHVDNINLRQYVKENTREYDSRVFEIQNELNNIN
jgi:hypothetical protein